MMSIRRALSQERVLITLLFICSLTIRAGYAVWQHQHATPATYLAGDGLDYNTTAVNIMAGNGFWTSDGGGSLYKAQPLYPLILAAFYSLTGVNYFALVLLQAIISAATSVLVFITARRLFGFLAGAIAGFLFSICPYAIYYTNYPITETLTIFLMSLLALAGTAYAENPSRGTISGIGLLAGLLGLTRPEIFVLIPFLAGWLFVIAPTKKQAFIHCLIFGTVFMCMVEPWGLYHSVKQGRFVLPIVALQSKLQDCKILSEAELEKFVWPPGYQENARYINEKQNASKNKSRLSDEQLQAEQTTKKRTKNLRGVLQKFKTFFSLGSDIFPAVALLNMPLFFLGFAGMVLSWHQWRKTLFIVLLIVSWTLPHLIFVAHARYNAPIRPYFMMFAAFVLSRCYYKVKSLMALQD